MNNNSFVSIINNAQQVIDAMEKQAYIGLREIGREAEKYAKGDAPVGTPESTGIPDYIGGTLRGSITFATERDHSEGQAPATSEDYAVRNTPEPMSVYIGTNVRYAPYVEFIDRYYHPTGKAHFLRDAASTHGDRYKEIMEAALKT